MNLGTLAVGQTIEINALAGLNIGQTVVIGKLVRNPNPRGRKPMVDERSAKQWLKENGKLPAPKPKQILRKPKYGDAAPRHTHNEMSKWSGEQHNKVVKAHHDHYKEARQRGDHESAAKHMAAIRMHALMSKGTTGKEASEAKDIYHQLAGKKKNSVVKRNKEWLQKIEK